MDTPSYAVTMSWTDPPHIVTGINADDALTQRIRRLKEVGTPHTVDWPTVSYVDRNGVTVTLRYEDA